MATEEELRAEQYRIDQRLIEAQRRDRARLLAGDEAQLQRLREAWEPMLGVRHADR